MNEMGVDASANETPFFTTAGNTANQVYSPGWTGAFIASSRVRFVVPSNSVSSTRAASAPVWSLTTTVCPPRSHAGEQEILACSFISAPASTTSGEISTEHVVCRRI